MHIVIDARIINSGTGTYARELLNNLQEIDHDNQYTVLVPTKDRGFWKPTNDSFTVQTVDYDNYSFAEQLGFKKFLEKLNPDLVHFCMPQQPVLYRGKTITTFHDLTLLNTYNSDKNWLVFHAKQLVGQWVFRHVAHKSDLVIVPTRFTGDELVKFSGISPDKIRQTYEAADVHIEQTTPYPTPFDKFILYVGQQPDYKNLRRLGDAHRQLLDKYPDLGLVFAGRKQPDTLRNEAYFETRGYKNIHFTDFVPDEQRDWLFQHCAVYAFPSLMEGFGLPGLEAMGYGAPVVSSNATCLPEVYGDAAHYFDPLNTNDIARAIDEVLSNDTLRGELIAKGRAQHAKYSWRRMAEQTHAAYMEILNKK